MPNPRFNTQVRNLKVPTSGGKGVEPLPSGTPSTSIPERTAAWPGLLGKAGPDRSAGVPEEKVYAFAEGLRGGKEVADGDE